MHRQIILFQDTKNENNGNNMKISFLWHLCVKDTNLNRKYVRYGTVRRNATGIMEKNGTIESFRRAHETTK